MAAGLVATGLLMLAKLDTPFWQRNPYWLSETTWGIVYTIHGICATLALADDHRACVFRAAAGARVTCCVRW